MNSTIIAVDPGRAGGVAVCVLGVAGCQPMPDTEGDIVAMLRTFKSASDKSGLITECVMEAVGGFAGARHPGSAMFKFGENYGFLKGVVQTLGIKLTLVKPQVWQKAFGLGTASRCASKSAWKNKLKAEAQRRFPHLEVTLKTADALLILEWRLTHSASRTCQSGEISQEETERTERGERRPETGNRRPETGERRGERRPEIGDVKPET